MEGTGSRSETTIPQLESLQLECGEPRSQRMDRLVVAVGKLER